MFWIVVVVGVSFVENPHEPRGGTCAPGVRRAACLSEGPACSTGWAFFGCLELGLSLVFKIISECIWMLLFDASCNLNELFSKLSPDLIL